MGSLGAARAAVIVSDSFTGTASTTLNARKPDTTDLPGTAYTSTVQTSGYALSSLTGNGTAQTGYNDANSLSIASVGSYTKPSLLNLSLRVQIGTLAEDSASSGRGIGLGFFTATPVTGAESNRVFTGLNVEPNGTLILEVGGVRTGTAAPAPTGFSTGTFYTLSYTVNTTTGALSSVLYNGVDDSSYFSGAVTSLTSVTTNLVGFYGSSATLTTNTGYVDDFAVSSAVPEPATWMEAAGLLGVAGWTLRHRLRRA